MPPPQKPKLPNKECQTWQAARQTLLGGLKQQHRVAAQRDAMQRQTSATIRTATWQPSLQSCITVTSAPSQVARPREAERTLIVQPRRWVIERLLCWFGRSRRLSKDYEALPELDFGHF